MRQCLGSIKAPTHTERVIFAARRDLKGLPNAPDNVQPTDRPNVTPIAGSRRSIEYAICSAALAIRVDGRLCR
jgi:hypothetical protein